MLTNVSIDKTWSDISNISARSKKYVTCLQMVHQILERELGVTCGIQVFNQLGFVASVIDLHLDKLSLTEKEQMLSGYGQLFNILWNQEEYLLFKLEISAFLEHQNFDTMGDALYLQDLYLFVQYCKNHGLKSMLFDFGHTIIGCAIQKHKVTSTKEVALVLRQEGEAVIFFLKQMLHSECKDYLNFDDTMGLLQEFEHILNLADDTIDVSSDRRRGLINKQIGKIHQPILVVYLITQLANTILRFPKKSLYYGPKLTWYFIRKAY